MELSVITGDIGSNLRILIVEGGEDRYFVCSGDAEADAMAKKLARENKGTALRPGLVVHVLKPSRVCLDDGEYKNPLKRGD